MRSNITVHMIVKNEEQWIWFAIVSVLPFVQKLLIYDTGSDDKTVKIIKHINSPKISFKGKGKVSPQELVTLRNEQLKKTTTDWFILLDGDEVWPEKSLESLIKIIDQAPTNLTAVVVPSIVPVGDLFHYQPESAGKYSLLGRIGHYNIRAYRRRKGYRWEGVYPLEAYIDIDGVSVQKKDNELILLDSPYWHMTHLRISSSEVNGKRKFEIGEKLPHLLPQVFYQIRPNIVSSPWVTFSTTERLIAEVSTPFINLKRKLKL